MAQNEILLLSIAFICILIYLKFMADSSYDTPKEKAIKAAEKQQKDTTV